MAAASGNAKGRSRRGCRGCIGCLLGLIIVAVLLVAAWFVLPPLLRSAGILPPDAEEVYSGAPDPEASGAVGDALAAAGIEGARAVVLPSKGRNRQLAVVTLDDSAQVTGTGPAAAESAFLDSLRGITRVSRSGGNLERTVFDLRDAEGNPLLAFTASQATIEAFLNGDITRTEFLRQVDADLSSLFNISDPDAISGSLSGPGAELFGAMAVEWIVAKDIVRADCPPPFDAGNCNFTVNPAEIARWRVSRNPLLGGALGVVGGRSMDDEAATALDAVDVVVKMEQAFELADEGLAEDDLEKIDRAIDLRPDDWSLHDRRAALLLARGRTDEAQSSLDRAESLVASRIRGGEDCSSLRLNLARNRRDTFSQQSQRFATNDAIRARLQETESEITSLESGQSGGPCS